MTKEDIAQILEEIINANSHPDSRGAVHIAFLLPKNTAKRLLEVAAKASHAVVNRMAKSYLRRLDLTERKQHLIGLTKTVPIRLAGQNSTLRRGSIARGDKEVVSLLNRLLERYIEVGKFEGANKNAIKMIDALLYA